MIKNKYKAIRIVLISTCFAVSSCAWEEPTHFKQSTMRLEEEKVEHTIAAADLSETSLKALAAHYRKHGDGPLNVTLTYDPKSKVNTAMKASEKASEVAGVLRKEGIHDLNVNILPVQDSETPQALVSYMGYNALAPEDCTLLPGIENRNVHVDEDYKLGCSVDTIFARQIARPKDLLGQRNGEYTDGRRAANIGDYYRSGAPNEPLNGESASGD